MEGGRDPFFGFGDPFSSFNGFGGFRGQRSLISGFFGGRDPFDDPFFRRPFGSVFESSFFGSAGGPFMTPQASGFLEHQPPQPKASRGPIIEELSSDEEKGETERVKEKTDNPRKHGRSNKEPLVEYPDDEVAEKKSKHMHRRNEISQMQHARSQPQFHSISFQSSSVSYGGANGTYYSSSKTRRAGSDGLTFEEFKEADTSTGQATHMISRGIHDKGHSVTRNLKSDGHVDTMQTLHNLNEDEVVGFEEAWKGKARKHLTGVPEGFVTQDYMGSGSSSQRRPNGGGGWALPSTERSNNQGILKPEGGDRTGPPPRQSGRRIIQDSGDGIGSSCFGSTGSGSSGRVNRF